MQKNMDFVKGVCYTMCPKDELLMRGREGLVHALEASNPSERGCRRHADPNKMVKCYSRSAADMKMAVPKLLRPFPVLYATVQYLLLEVTGVRATLPVVYDFIDDRLRAVRQDMTIQVLPPAQSVLILEPMVRFYILYRYKLSEYPLKDFDPVLNRKHLLECMKLLLVSFDDIELDSATSVDGLATDVAGLRLDNRDGIRANLPKLSCDRVLMESIYLLANMDDVHPLHRYLKLPRKVRGKSVNLAYAIALANWNGNYIRTCRLAPQLCPLSLCAFAVFLPTVQRRALCVMSHAYSSKQLSVPCAALRDLLLFNSSSEACDVSVHYGLVVTNSDVYFNKGNFNSDALLLPPRKMLVCADKLQLTVQEMFTYTS